MREHSPEWVVVGMPTIDHLRATAPLFELNVSFRSLFNVGYGKCSFVIIPEQIGVSGGTLEKPTPIVPVGRGGICFCIVPLFIQVGLEPKNLRPRFGEQHVLITGPWATQGSQIPG
ncbi:predicted protein [Histoplasma capsulatum var. duboisii H88]|uniref:Predicted protein n=1 Tax=Ajellomyces capsulatus (strain H88) TaxID=544711 RepID=F0U800_AJEC8|nr:predicted protein [Histoplasma capsulatum var. duboisii H88]